MPDSMTGYGRGVSEHGGRTVTVECRSVNHRFLDLSLKTPAVLAPLEPEIRQILKDRLSRGHVDVYVTSSADDTVKRNVTVDAALAAAYRDAFLELESIAGRPSPDLAALIAAQKGVFTVEDNDGENEAGLPEQLREALDEALDGLLSTRREEGRRLAEDLSGKAAEFRGLVAEVERRSPEVVALYRKKLLERAEALFGDPAPEWYDHQRLFAETALFADRSAIDEEITRLLSHLSALESGLAADGPVGRKLDFQIQEMNREVNTIGSKANDLEIAETVVRMKTLLEKIREQVQNIE